MLESYIRTGDGTDYVEVDNVREALGIKEDENIFRAIEKLKAERDELKDNLRITENALKTVKKERDELKERLRTYRFIANGTYGDSCGYSGDKTPAFLCDVISYSWSFGAIDTPFPNNSIRVELKLTPTANYKGTFDLEDLKKYIQAYGREKKLGIVESFDYQNAKVARAELAHLYKTVLGKEKLDRDLSPHEVMKAIYEEYKRVRDSKLAFSQSLQSVYMHIYEGTGYNVSDIYAAPDKLADEIITRYDSTKKLSDFEIFCKLVNNCIDELCDKHNVVQPARSKTTRERLEYIFSALTDYRNIADSNFNKAVEFRKEKRALEDSLAELRAKVREIYRSVVDDEWPDHFSYTSALNDINEEYKRVLHNFEERTADWSKAQQELDRYKLAVGSLLDIPEETRGDINAIERSFNVTNKKYVSLKEFRNNVCEIFDIPSSMADSYILKEIHDYADRYDELDRLRSNICTALCLGHESCDGNIIGRIHMMQECHEKLCKDYTELRKAYHEQYRLRQHWHVRYGSEHKRANGEHKRAEKLQKDYAELGEAYSSVLKWNNTYAEVRRLLGVSADADAETIISAVKLLRDKDPMDIQKKNDDLIAGYNKLMSYKIQIEKELHKKDLKLSDSERRRKMWMVRYESEHKRANGEHRRAENCFNDIAALKTQVSHLMRERDAMVNEEVGLQSLKNAVRKLQDEKTKVIEALGQDIWDDAVK